MKRLPRLAPLWLALPFCATQTLAQNGTLIEQTSYKIPVASYQEWVDGLKRRSAANARDTAFDEQTFRRNNPPELFARMQKGDGIECFKLKYLSDGLQVAGYLVKPKTISGKLPVVVYNHGGNRGFGRMMLAESPG